MASGGGKSTHEPRRQLAHLFLRMGSALIEVRELLPNLFCIGVYAYENTGF